MSRPAPSYGHRMASGLGFVQRHVLARAGALGPDEWVTAGELAEQLYGDRAEGHVQAVRRAIRDLERRGMVGVEYVAQGGAVVLAVRGPAR